MATCPDCGRMALTEQPHRHPETGYLPGMAYGTGGNRLDAARAEFDDAAENIHRAFCDPEHERVGAWDQDMANALRRRGLVIRAETPALDVEAIADLFMDLRLDGPAGEGWTYQQTARHYAAIIASRLTEAKPHGG